MDRQPPGHRENISQSVVTWNGFSVTGLYVMIWPSEQRGKTAKPRVGVQWNSATGLQKTNAQIELGVGVDSD